MIENLYDHLPFFVTDRIRDVLERCATLPSLGLDPERKDAPAKATAPIDVKLLDKPGGGVAYEFQRTALKLFETRDVAGPAKSALDRANFNYEKALRHRWAGDHAMAAFEKAEIAHQKAIALHQSDVDKFDNAREEHAAATARLVQELTRALLIVQKRDGGRLGKDYQALLSDLIFLRQAYAEESRIKEFLDQHIANVDLGGSNARQPKVEIPPVFDASLATSYASASYMEPPELDITLQSGERSVEEEKAGGENEESPAVHQNGQPNGGTASADGATIKPEAVPAEVAA
jgi:hypothetical protein